MRRGWRATGALGRPAPPVRPAGRTARLIAIRSRVATRAGDDASGGLSRAWGAVGPVLLAAASRPTARRTETAPPGIRHRRMRTRTTMERPVRAVWTGATRAGARPSVTRRLCGLGVWLSAGGCWRPVREAPRPGRSPQVWMTFMGARRPVARTARPARGADNPRLAACGGAGSPVSVRRAVGRERVSSPRFSERLRARAFFSPYEKRAVRSCTARRRPRPCRFAATQRAARPSRLSCTGCPRA